MRWINKLEFTIETKEKQWKVRDQIAGYVQKYREWLEIFTVEEAGHIVPQDQRASVYKFVIAFIDGMLP